jgi:hypothetical protein
MGDNNEKASKKGIGRGLSLITLQFCNIFFSAFCSSSSAVFLCNLTAYLNFLPAAIPL